MASHVNKPPVAVGIPTVNKTYTVQCTLTAAAMHLPLFTLLLQTQKHVVYSKNMLKFVGNCKAIPPSIFYMMI